MRAPSKTRGSRNTENAESRQGPRKWAIEHGVDPDDVTPMVVTSGGRILFRYLNEKLFPDPGLGFSESPFKTM